MFLSELRELPSAPCLTRKKENLMTVRVSMLLKSRTYLIFFRACSLPGRAKDFSALRYSLLINFLRNKPVLSVRDSFDFLFATYGNLNSNLCVSNFLGKA